ncbi:AAEL016996-PA [Aedes aegypti]|uniref:AAEL016996-PA n=1 Tax=Aedes aegypti TaxID=7159 RepID=J9HTC4_AEDAE|nr:AAEL016996-PA [Aedes aegypti]
MRNVHNSKRSLCEMGHPRTKQPREYVRFLLISALSNRFYFDQERLRTFDWPAGCVMCIIEVSIHSISYIVKKTHQTR